MLSLPTAALDALQDPTTELRWMIWLTARDRSTGDPETGGFWSDLYSRTVTVVDPNTGATASRDYTGLGSLLDVQGITGASDLSAKAATVRLSQVDADVEQMIRGYDLRQAPIEIHFALFTPGTGELVANPYARFVGFVDEATIETPVENTEGGVTLRCMSHSRELTRSNSDVRSDKSQRRRNADDTGLKYVSVMGDLTLNWGKFDGKIA